MRAPNRWADKRLRAVARIEDDPISVADELVRRLRNIRRQSTSGAYVLVDSERYVYLLSEESGTAEVWTRRCPKMIVGLYASEGRALPSSSQLIEDIGAHLTQVLALP